MDIWVAEIVNGAARDLRPLGPPVNTPGNERSPWLDATSGTLWFASDHLPGLGGYDLFTAPYNTQGVGTPVNAGVPFNSPANDLYPMVLPQRGEGWLTSNRKGSFAAKGETCCNDLYRWRFPATADTLPVPVAIADTTVPVAITDLQAFQGRFPLKLYFHNDEPDPRSWAITTRVDYGDAYTAYRSLLPEYEREQEDPAVIDRFFTEEVDRGWNELNELTVALQKALDAGNSMTLEVRGHASPLARNDYNRNLSSRRIESLRNFLRKADDRSLLPYLNGTSANGATLVVRELPFGEEQAAAGVSDDLRDLKRSVYSLGAAQERRIEVVAVEWNDLSSSEKKDRLLKFVGPLEQGTPRQFVFTIPNNGQTPLRTTGGQADCGCTTAVLPDQAIPPGGSAEVIVEFSGRAPLGPFRRTVTVELDGAPGRIDLVIEGTVVP
jgi:hypothetical protein